MGAGIPLIALMGKQPEFRDYNQNQVLAQQIQGLKNQNALAPGQQQLQQEQIQGAQLQNQEKQQELQDQQALTKSMAMWDPSDPGSLPKLVIQNGGSGKAAFGLNKTILDMRKTALDNSETQNKLDAANNNYLAQGIANIEQMPPEQQAQAFEQFKGQAVQEGKLDAKHAQMFQYQSPQQLEALRKMTLGHNAVLDEASKQAAADKASQQADAATSNAATAAAKEAREAAAQGKVTERDKFIQSQANYRANLNKTVSGDDAKDIADAIESGDQPPTLTGLYKNAAPVRAELARRGVPIAKMEMDWNATKKFVGSMNSTQQLRLRQDITNVSDSLDKVEGLYNEWKDVAGSSGYKILNKANLAAMTQLPGRAGAVAQALQAQIADTTAGLGTIYMGGNSPTDHSLGLAAKSLSADWNDETFKEALKQARANVKIRQNSMIHAQPAGTSKDNTYSPTQDNAQPPANDFFSQFGGKAH